MTTSTASHLHRSVAVAAAPAPRRPLPGAGGHALGRPAVARGRWRPATHTSSASRVGAKAAAPTTQTNGSSSEPEGLDVDEAAVLRIVESLSGEDRAKALELWEENKRMRIKLAILEGVSELPAAERMRALSLLKQNRSLRSKTSALMASWEAMEGTVNSLIQAEVEAAGGGAVSDTDVLLSSTEVATLEGSVAGAPVLPADSSDSIPPPFWESGMGTAGLVTLLASTGPLELAMAKAEAILRDNTDEILNSYWERELGASPKAFTSTESAEVAGPSVEELSAAAVGDFEPVDATTFQPIVTNTGSEEADAVAAEIAEEEAEEAAPLEAMATAEAAAAELPPVATAEEVEVAVSDITQNDQMPADGELAQEAASRERRGGFASGRGGMAAAAGLGAGLLAVAAGMEATAAMEIMATTALITSASTIMADDEETGSVRKKGAGAPALVAIAATLNAAEQMARSIDKALDSEMVKATSQALSSATKIRQMAAEAKPDEKAALPSASPEPEVVAAVEENVVFWVTKQLPFGQSMKVVGSGAQLGEWDATKALPMTWDESAGAWTAAVKLPPGLVEFKFVVAADEELLWEAPMAGNRQLEVTDNSTVTQVRCEYDDVERLEVVAGIAEVEEPAKPAMPVADVDVPPAQVEDHPMTETVEMEMPGTDEKLIVFRVKKEVPFGNRLKVVGGSSQLGEWDSERAVPMEWGDGHVWSARVPLRPGECEFKFVVASDSGDHVYWEAMPGNRRLEVPSDVALVVAEAEFEGGDSMQVSMDEQALLLGREGNAC